MTKALQGGAVVHLPRTLNNTGHGSLRLARRVKFVQVVDQIFTVTNCIVTLYTGNHVKDLVSYCFRELLNRFNAMFGVTLSHKGEREPEATR